MKLVFEKEITWGRTVEQISIAVEAEYKEELLEAFKAELQEQVSLLFGGAAGTWGFSINRQFVSFFQDSNDEYGKGRVGHNVLYSAGSYTIEEV